MRLFLLLAFFGVAAAGVQSPAPPHPVVRAIVTPSPLPPEALYSRRALRRARLFITLRMMELRDERLDCVRNVILNRLPPDLRPEEPSSPSPSPSGACP